MILLLRQRFKLLKLFAARGAECLTAHTTATIAASGKEESMKDFD
jgi:hypothetical protein